MTLLLHFNFHQARSIVIWVLDSRYNIIYLLGWQQHISDKKPAFSATLQMGDKAESQPNKTSFTLYRSLMGKSCWKYQSCFIFSYISFFTYYKIPVSCIKISFTKISCTFTYYLAKPHKH